jgi:hypothetical protein
MRKFLASTFVLALFAVAFAGPPIDYELFCVEDGELIGVLSLTEGKVHVALVAEVVCDGANVFVSGPDSALAIVVDWTTDPPTVTVTIDDVEAYADDVDLVVVPQVAIDGMLNAHSLRAVAMLLRDEAAARRDAARAGEHDASDDREASGPPEGVPPVAPPVGRP